ncbi:MAG: hypothetical protein R3D89_04165 [Sphingomonadaceae bacterium]
MTSTVRLAATASLAAIALLAGCDSGKQEDASLADGDPAMTGALGDQIMVDPELTGQEGGAVTAGGAGANLPPEQRGPEAIAAAKQDAEKKAGGALQSAPEPGTGNPASLIEDASTAAQVAEASKAAATDCAGKVEYSMNWTTKLPAALGVYPRGAVQEAAGTDKDGCALRVVNFVSPVDPGDIIDYYYTQARKAGYNADYRMDGGDHVLGGKNGGQAYLIYARKLDNGLSEVDLIASGK